MDETQAARSKSESGLDWWAPGIGMAADEAAWTDTLERAGHASVDSADLPKPAAATTGFNDPAPMDLQARVCAPPPGWPLMSPAPFDPAKNEPVLAKAIGQSAISGSGSGSAHGADMIGGLQSSGSRTQPDGSWRVSERLAGVLEVIGGVLQCHVALPAVIAGLPIMGAGAVTVDLPGFAAGATLTAGGLGLCTVGFFNVKAGLEQAWYGRWVVDDVQQKLTGVFEAADLPYAPQLALGVKFTADLVAPVAIARHLSQRAATGAFQAAQRKLHEGRPPLIEREIASCAARVKAAVIHQHVGTYHASAAALYRNYVRALTETLAGVSHDPAVFWLRSAAADVAERVVTSVVARRGGQLSEEALAGIKAAVLARALQFGLMRSGNAMPSIAALSEKLDQARRNILALTKEGVEAHGQAFFAAAEDLAAARLRPTLDGVGEKSAANFSAAMVVDAGWWQGRTVARRIDALPVQALNAGQRPRGTVEAMDDAERWWSDVVVPVRMAARRQSGQVRKSVDASLVQMLDADGSAARGLAVAAIRSAQSAATAEANELARASSHFAEILQKSVPQAAAAKAAPVTPEIAKVRGEILKAMEKWANRHAELLVEAGQKDPAQLERALSGELYGF